MQCQLKSFWPGRYAVSPSSTKRENLGCNLLTQKLKLTEDEVKQIAKLECNVRLVSSEGLAPNWDEFRYNEFFGPHFAGFFAFITGYR
jgi:hypothetical protein